MGLWTALTLQIIAGTNGLLTGTNLANHNVTTETTFDLYQSQFVGGRVDGRYASDYADLRAVLGQESFAHADATYRADESDISALDRMRAKVGGVRVSAHVPDLSARTGRTTSFGWDCAGIWWLPFGRMWH